MTCNRCLMLDSDLNAALEKLTNLRAQLETANREITSLSVSNGIKSGHIDLLQAELKQLKKGGI